MSGDKENLQAELLRCTALVEDNLRTLGVDPVTAKAPAPGGDGHAWAISRGSAQVVVFLRGPRQSESEPFLRVVAPIVQLEPTRAEALFRRLLELNARGLSSVAFGLQGDRVLVVSERPTRGLDAAELAHILQVVGRVADHYDDALVAEFGGVRVADRR